MFKKREKQQNVDIAQLQTISGNILPLQI